MSGPGPVGYISPLTSYLFAPVADGIPVLHTGGRNESFSSRYVVDRIRHRGREDARNNVLHRQRRPLNLARPDLHREYRSSTSLGEDPLLQAAQYYLQASDESGFVMSEGPGAYGIDVTDVATALQQGAESVFRAYWYDDYADKTLRHELKWMARHVHQDAARGLWTPHLERNLNQIGSYLSSFLFLKMYLLDQANLPGPLESYLSKSPFEAIRFVAGVEAFLQERPLLTASQKGAVLGLVIEDYLSPDPLSNRFESLSNYLGFLVLHKMLQEFPEIHVSDQSLQLQPEKVHAFYQSFQKIYGPVTSHYSPEIVEALIRNSEEDLKAAFILGYMGGKDANDLDLGPRLVSWLTAGIRFRISATQALGMAGGDWLGASLLGSAAFQEAPPSLIRSLGVGALLAYLAASHFSLMPDLNRMNAGSAGGHLRLPTLSPQSAGLGAAFISCLMPLFFGLSFPTVTVGAGLLGLSGYYWGTHRRALLEAGVAKSRFGADQEDHPPQEPLTIARADLSGFSGQQDGERENEDHSDRYPS